jgi:hypothetical protein
MSIEAQQNVVSPLAAIKQALEALENTLGFTGSREIDSATRQAITSLRTAIEQLEDAEFYSAEYWKGHDDAVRGVAKRWEEALTAPIPKAGVMNEPLESLYRRTEALRTAIEETEKQEPVAWVNYANLQSAAVTRNRGGQGDTHSWSETPTAYHSHPLYTTPPTAPVQEPVAYQDIAEKCRLETVPAKGTLLHTSPPASKSWQGLTGEGIDKLADMHRKE